MDMITQLRAVRNRYDEINNQLQDPTVINNNELYRSLMKDYKNLTPIVEAYDAYDAAKGAFDEAKEMLDEGGLDAEFKELAQAEYEENKEKMAFLDENDDRSVIVEIRGGAGGEEAALFAHSLFRMYTMYAETRGWKYEVLNANETELGGMKEVSFSIEGEGAYSRLKFESGVHRVQRVPETETQGRVHTSTVTVAVMPEAEELAQKQAEHDSKIAAERRSQVGTGDRSERIRTYNYPQGRLTDHRIGLTLYKLDTILNGVLDEVVDALVTADQAEKLKASTEE